VVDLAKIRKKAKAGQGAGQGAGGRAQGAGEPAAQTVPPTETAPPPGNQPATLPPGTEPRATSNQQPTDSEARERQAVSKLDRFKADAGKRRDAIKTVESEAPQSMLELLTFLIAGEQYAVEIEHIVEIVPPRAVTRIPNADPSVVGIVSLRGTIVTLLDVRRQLGHPGEAVGDSTRVVVIEFRNETVGFTVDRVLRVVKLAAAEVEPHPVVHATELEASIRGVFRVSGALTILLDLDKLLDSRSTLVNA
jgi:purine-binding chemotaxis protein CheW